MLVVGLTGNIASGKSTVSRMLASHGVRVIDSDVLAREAVAPGSPALAQIAARWGEVVLRAGGALDRAALRERVFSDATERTALDAIVHPEVARRRDGILRAARAAGERVVICDIPLLFEAGLTAEVDTIVLVDAPEPVRLARLVADRHLAPAIAAAMMAAQLPAGDKRSRADYIIDNAGSLADLEAHVSEVWREIARRAGAAAP